MPVPVPGRRRRDRRDRLGDQPFCRGCTSARLSAEGSLYTCLFAGAGHDVRGRLRGAASDEVLRAQVASVWTRRADRYSELCSLATRPEQKVEMSHIGG
jgi:cyclic pyranopterin phosphate synthase